MDYTAGGWRRRPSAAKQTGNTPQLHHLLLSFPCSTWWTRSGAQPIPDAVPAVQHSGHSAAPITHHHPSSSPWGPPQAASPPTSTPTHIHDYTSTTTHCSPLFDGRHPHSKDHDYTSAPLHTHRRWWTLGSTLTLTLTSTANHTHRVDGPGVRAHLCHSTRCAARTRFHTHRPTPSPHTSAPPCTHRRWWTSSTSPSPSSRPPRSTGTCCASPTSPSPETGRCWSCPRPISLGASAGGASARRLEAGQEAGAHATKRW